MIPIDHDSTQPLYQQVVQGVSEAIISGQLQPGQKLPARRILAEELGVNMVTVRSAYLQLEQQGIVVSRHGTGTFVCFDAPDRLQTGGRWYDTITVVIGADQLGDCRREAIHIISDILSGVSEVLGARCGRYVFVSDINARNMRSVSKQGAVLLYQLGGQTDEASVRELQGRGIPVIVAWGGQVPMALPRVHYDAYAAAEVGPRHLVDCGYRRIGFMGLKSSSDISLGIKFLQFTNVLQEAGLDLLARDVRHVRNIPGEACLAMMQMLAAGDLPDALFIDTDFKAMESLQAIHHAGLKVPDDIGIVSFDGFAESSRFTPKLTVVRTPRRAIGTRIGELLTQWPSQNMDHYHQLLPAELIQGQTTRKVQLSASMSAHGD